MLKLVPESGPIQKIIYDDEVYAIVIRASLPFKGYNFVSDDQDSLQVGVNHYERGRSPSPIFICPSTAHCMIHWSSCISTAVNAGSIFLMTKKRQFIRRC